MAALFGGCLLTVPFLLLAAGLTLWMGALPLWAMRIPAVLGWGLAAFHAAKRIARNRRRHGLVRGAVTGILFWGMRLGGALLLGIQIRAALPFLVWLIAAGSIGGVLGTADPAPTADPRP